MKIHRRTYNITAKVLFSIFDFRFFFFLVAFVLVLLFFFLFYLDLLYLLSFVMEDVLCETELLGSSSPPPLSISMYILFQRKNTLVVCIVSLPLSSRSPTLPPFSLSFSHCFTDSLSLSLNKSPY